MACNSVEAKIIGNRSHRTTTIIIGTTPSILMERDQIVTEVERLLRDREELEKNVAYLERNNAEDNVQMKALYTQMKLRLSVVRMQYSVAQKKLEKLDSQRRDMSKCPPTEGGRFCVKRRAAKPVFPAFICRTLFIQVIISDLFML